MSVIPQGGTPLITIPGNYSAPAVKTPIHNAQAATVAAAMPRSGDGDSITLKKTKNAEAEPKSTKNTEAEEFEKAFLQAASQHFGIGSFGKLTSYGRNPETSNS